jgi:hypothetical protein
MSQTYIYTANTKCTDDNAQLPVDANVSHSLNYPKMTQNSQDFEKRLSTCPVEIIALCELTESTAVELEPSVNIVMPWQAGSKNKKK